MPPLAPTNVESQELSNVPYRLVEAMNWTLVSVWAGSAGVSISTKKSNTGNGAQLPLDRPVYVLLGPSASLYAYASVAGVRVSYAVQPLPPINLLLKGLC